MVHLGRRKPERLSAWQPESEIRRGHNTEGPGSGRSHVRSAGADSADVAHSDTVSAAVRMLRELPDAAISAVSVGGFFVPMPPEVPLHGQTVIVGHATALEFVAPEDLRVVTSAWQDAHERGTASAVVRAVGSAGGEMTVHYVDATAEFGVFLCFIVGDVDFVRRHDGDAGAMRPRVSVVRKTNQAVFISVDDAAQVLLGRADLVGRRNADLIHPEDAPRAIANWMDMLAVPGESRRVRLRQQHGDGSWVWFEITNHNRLNDPNERCVVSEMVDISEEMAAQERLRMQEALLRQLTDSLPVGVAHIDPRGVVVHHNRRLLEILELPQLEHADDLLGPVIDADRDALRQALLGSHSAREHPLEVAVGGANRPAGHWQVTVTALEQSEGAIVCLSDVTDSVRLREDLHYRATHDPLTGCLNRASILGELEIALTTKRDGDAGVAVAFIDLDRFKAVNDTSGHGAGDDLLTAIGHCLQAVVRETDAIGRFGGDEFLVVATAVPGFDDAQLLGERIREALALRFTPEAGGAAIASIGVAWAPQATTITAHDLISLADAAMYRSKADGRGEPVIDRAALGAAA